MIREPARRADGLCFTCERARAVGDAFCSSKCARTFYGTSLPEVKRAGRPRSFGGAEGRPGVQTARRAVEQHGGFGRRHQTRFVA